MRRTWELGPYTDDFGNLIPPSDEEVARETMGAVFAAGRFGGGVVVAPKRVEYPDGRFETVGWIFKYDSGNVPAVKLPAADEEPEPVAEAELEAEAEPVAAE